MRTHPSGVCCIKSATSQFLMWSKRLLSMRSWITRCFGTGSKLISQETDSPNDQTSERQLTFGSPTGKQAAHYWSQSSKIFFGTNLVNKSPRSTFPPTFWDFSSSCSSFSCMQSCPTRTCPLPHLWLTPSAAVESTCTMPEAGI